MTLDIVVFSSIERGTQCDPPLRKNYVYEYIMPFIWTSANDLRNSTVTVCVDVFCSVKTEKGT